jgi:hypothetical protein
MVGLLIEEVGVANRVVVQGEGGVVVSVEEEIMLLRSGQVVGCSRWLLVVFGDVDKGALVALAASLDAVEELAPLVHPRVLHEIQK